MPLNSGARLGPYEIVAPIGAGGMGEVYRARDTRLERTVAVKVLPSHLAASADSRQRFEREARTISQLSHPHICALYDVGHEGETEYLVMEYLEGETLAERLARGPLPLDQTVRFGVQIADALDRAHRHGVVHRDLKPGNVMVTRSGVKLLDFGLARTLERSLDATGREQAAAGQHPTAGVNATAVPTLMGNPGLTQRGTILGTLQYMAPEQLEGKEADARTDIFAFGCVLYEMATGNKAHAGATQASLISSILRDDPVPISQVQPMTPRALDRVVKVCLAKDPDDRWQSARDVGMQLSAVGEQALEPTSAAIVSRRPRIQWAPWLVAVLALIGGAIALLQARAPRTEPASTIRFSMSPPADGAFAFWMEGSFLAVSPDGTQLAYVASDSRAGAKSVGPLPPEEKRRVFLRALSSPEARPIPGTDGANSIFFSPDGRSLAFFTKDKLKRVELSGGAPVTICDAVAGGLSGTWSRSGEIIFGGPHRRALSRVSAGGGVPAEIFPVDPARGERRILWPSYLPDGERFLYLLRYADGRGDLMLAEPGRKPRPVMAVQSHAQYSDPGYILFAKEGTLLAQRFDAKSGSLKGDPFSVAETVRYALSPGTAAFAVSRTGTLVYQPNENVLRLAWFDRTGREVETVGSPGLIQNIAISPDGRRLLFDRARPGMRAFDIWLRDLERGTETPVTSALDTEVYARWLPDGRIAYSVVRGSPPQLVRRNLATGREEDLLPGGKMQFGQDVSPDGKTLLYTERADFFHVWTLPLSGTGKPAPFLKAPFEKQDVRFSPDGRYVSMITDESGQPEAYVTAYPGPGERIRVSTGGAQSPRWSRDGRELLYLSGDRRLMSAPVRTSPSFELGAPRALFELAGRSWSTFEVSADGKRFLAIVPEVVADELPISVVVSWAAGHGKK
ncbi:MAG TPA: protein kinase [Thermoanaerobaculia bacterium]|nr:protein kinase [Thermoanaerobaculia bacterium]